MARLLILLTALITAPVFAAELGDSYVKLFQMQVQLASGGNASAEYSLGEMYEQGLGTEEDIQKAYEWYEKAAAKGDVRAKHKLASRASDAAGDSSREQAALAEAAKEIAAKDKKRAAAEEKARKKEMARKKARVKALLEKQANRQNSYETE
jgi:TPR repeat protein